ncbi:LysR family transcriptional regulator [Citrobacter koseri]|uniref:LysR family transcriptional regulator n=1 Tax=Citrobacter koseri TaxID=545 RepID=A0A447UTV1_CITKO|nr:LysR family transcriptional regulator [Citrobacter koseri]
MNSITNSAIDFTPLVNEPFVLACRRNHPLASKQLVEWQELVGYKLIGVRSSSGNRLLIEHNLADKPWKLDWFYEVRHLSTSLGLVEAGLGISALPGLAMPQTVASHAYRNPVDRTRDQTHVRDYPAQRRHSLSSGRAFFLSAFECLGR